MARPASGEHGRVGSTGHHLYNVAGERRPRGGLLLPWSDASRVRTGEASVGESRPG
jgi:hypothetical protein